MHARTLAEEEPGVVSVAVRPGMVDTNVRDNFLCDRQFPSHF
jgi:hypothetical protein